MFIWMVFFDRKLGNSYLRKGKLRELSVYIHGEMPNIFRLVCHLNRVLFCSNHSFWPDKNKHREQMHTNKICCLFTPRANYNMFPLLFSFCLFVAQFALLLGYFKAKNDFGIKQNCIIMFTQYFQHVIYFNRNLRSIGKHIIK